MRWPAVLISLTLTLSGCEPPGNPSVSLQDCLKSAYGDALVRIDGANHRAFLVWSMGSGTDGLVELVRSADVCMATDSQWAQRYSLSMFSEARFAGYMTDEHILPLVKSGIWEEAYLAEYDRAGETLTLMPIVAPEEVPLKP